MDDGTNASQDELKQLILAETRHFMNRDFDSWADCWAQDEDSSILECRPSFAEEIRGWKAISEYMYGLLKEGTTELGEGTEKTDFAYQLGKELAFVSFKENGNSSTRLLKRVKGEWKICHVGVVYTAIYEREGNYIYDWETRNTKLEKTGIIDDAQ